MVRWLTTSSVKKLGSKIDTRQGRQSALATRNNITDIETMTMTADEFIVEGFNNAEMAESDDVDLEAAHNSLDRAIWCFDQAKDLKLAAKARTHRLSIQFRLELMQSQENNAGYDGAMAELKGAQMMESLAKEGLLFETMNVYYSIGPFLSTYAKEELEKQFVSKVRAAT